MASLCASTRAARASSNGAVRHRRRRSASSSTSGASAAAVAAAAAASQAEAYDSLLPTTAAYPDATVECSSNNLLACNNTAAPLAPVVVAVAVTVAQVNVTA